MPVSARAVAAIAALGLLAVPLLARPGAGPANEVADNLAEEVNAIEVDASADLAPCSDPACRRVQKEVEQAVRELEAAADAVANAAEPEPMP